MKTEICAFLLLLIIPAASFAFAEHVFNPEAHAQYLDISQIETDKFVFEFDETAYEIYYGYHGSMDDSFTEDEGEPVVREMSINQERKSIEVTFEKVPETTDFWVRIPFED